MSVPPHHGNNVVILASSTEPKLSQRTGTFGKHSGRRLTSAPSSQDKKDDGARIFPTNASMEEIDRMLEDDAFALLNIKKEITNSQQDELTKLRVAVMAAKKEYDSMHIANNILEKEVNSFQAKIISLQGVDKSSLANNFAMQDIVNDLTERNSEVLTELAAEQRTIKMLSLMIKRYDAEIAQCRLDTAKANTHVEHAKHDLLVTEHSAQNHRQELLELEMEHEKMQSTVKQRQDQREGKITMLHTLSAEGEQSVTRLQHSLMETTKRSQHTSNKARIKSAGLKGGPPRSISEPEEEELPEGSDDLAIVARRMNIDQVREVIQRYKSQSSRMEKLHLLDSDLRANIAMQQRKKQELSEQLGQAEFKIQQLASSRQIYQEVDLKDSALAATSKECDDCKDRDFRLRLNIESLKQSIPRFLTKVTRVIHPKPTETQLGDAVLKLDDELTKLIKVIGSALLKDATPDDLAMMSQQSATSGVSEAHSEFARLQRLPGYARMKRQLFFNLMTARPDVSEQNIRIEHMGKVKQPKSTIGNPPLVPGGNSHNQHNGHSLGAPNTNANMSPRGKKIAAQANQHILSDNSRPSSTDILMDDKIFAEDASLDRTTIKNISKLIYERDYNKSKLVALADAAKKNF